MPTFVYKARNQQGELVNGRLEMEDERNVALELDRMGYSVIEISQSSNTAPGAFQNFIEQFRRVDKQQIVFFTRQLAILIRSGMPLLPSLGTIIEQTSHKKFKGMIEDVRDTVQGGVSFSDALAKYPQAFSELFVSMIRVGEAGGIMDQVLERLANLSTQEMEIQSRIKSAMTYPIVLVILAFLIVNFIMVGVLPKFVMVFNSSQAELPLPTKIILGMSWAVRNYWYLFIIAAGALVVYFRAFIATEAGKMSFHRFLLKIPIFGDLYTKIQISRFSRTIATLTRSGIPILQALTVVEKTVTNQVLRRAIQNIKTAITAGSSLVEPFKASGLFSPMVVQMISIGEKSGKIDQMFEEISGFYDPEIEYKIKNLTALLEPFMLLSMGLMVGFIALSVLLPIFNLMKVFRT
jgi:type II secretory pathway component PulF